MHISRNLVVPTLLLSLSAAAPAKSQPATEVYYLTNCFVSITNTAWAEIDYFSNRKTSAAYGGSSKPDLREIIASTDVDFEDGTFHTKPGTDALGNFTAIIGVDAYTAPAGTVVGSATASAYKGTLKCERIKRVMLFAPGKESNCYSDYACV